MQEAENQLNAQRASDNAKIMAQMQASLEKKPLFSLPAKKEVISE